MGSAATKPVSVIIDTPQGSRNKYKYDKAKRHFRLAKVLPAGTVFPFNFGYIPETSAADGDPLDVLVLMDEAAFVGCMIEVRLIGVIEAEQSKAGAKAIRNDRLVAIAVESHTHQGVTDLKQVSAALLDEIEHFFVSYNLMERQRFTPLGRYGAKRARKLLAAGQRH